MIRELVVISGKGGTGKTSVTAALAALNPGAIVCDCDVDAPNLGILLRPAPGAGTPFVGGQKASIDPEQCVECGLCEEMCRFRAIQGTAVDTLRCEGCGFCSRLCPVEAVSMREHVAGEWHVSATRLGTLVHARMGVGEENSGKLVALLRRQARQVATARGGGLILTDGPPGTGCPVIACLAGCSLAAIVVEPSVFALHDMERAVGLCRHFRVRCGVIINKADLNPAHSEEIRRFCARQGLPLWGELPYDPAFVEAVNECRTPVEHSPRLAARLEEVWRRIEESLAEGGPGLG